MPAYKDVQTGANTQFGGLNDGLFNVAYHGKFCDVILPFTNPPRFGKITAAAIWNLWSFNIVILFWTWLQEVALSNQLTGNEGLVILVQSSYDGNYTDFW